METYHTHTYHNLSYPMGVYDFVNAEVEQLLADAIIRK